MRVLRAAGAGPVLRAAGVGVAAALLALYVQLRGLLELLDPVAPEMAVVGAGALIVFVAATIAGVAGAWQAALAGVRTRREIVLVGAVCPGAVCAAASLVLSLAVSVDPGRALLEVAVIAAGAAAGDWLLPTVARMLARLRGVRGQTSAEYMGALVLVAIIIAAVVTVVPQIGDRVSGTIDAISKGELPSGTAGVIPTADDDGDGLTNEEEVALGTNAVEADSDGDGVSDNDEFTHGTDPLQGVEPLTEENFARPWERIGISEDEWNALEEAILDEINPGGIEGFLLGDAAESLTLDENGELTLIPPGAMIYIEDGELKVSELQEMGIGGGLVKGLAKILGAGGKSASTALRNALDKLPASLRTRLAGAGVLRGADAAAATTRALPRFAPGRWLPHFEKHAAEFGYRTPVEYLRGARDLVGRNGVQTFTRTNGDRLFYDAARNEFAVLRPDGVLRTYFRPQNGSQYWRSQTGG
jgi:thrombospondin type 3 repeat protein